MSKIIQKIVETRVVPVFYDPSPLVCAAVLEASHRAGLVVFELTNRGPAARENFLFLKKKIQRDGLDCSLGIGTVLTAHDADFFLENGAAFIVSPCFSEAVFERCLASNTLYLPGCQTIQAIFDCQNRGIELVKIFPGEVVGPAFLKAAKAVFPSMKMMVTGGVSPENAADWLAAGADALGLGSSISTALKTENGLEKLFLKMTNDE